MAKERKDTPSGANQFSVYAQRDTDSTQVDWGVIAKDLTTEVKRISEDRAKRRNDIEVSTQEAMKELSLVADLDNQSVNGFVIRGGNFSKNALQTQMELLRNGAIKPEEYQLFMQQQKDGYANLSLFAKNADDKYKAAMERLKNGEDGNQIASDLEIAFNEGTFDYTDLKNKQLITNPSTGEMLIVTLQEGKDGKMVIPNMKDNPELYQSLATLNNRTAFQLDRRNTGKLTDKIVDNLATVITAEDITTYSIGKGGGGIETIEDFTQLFNEKSRDLDFDTWMQTQIDTVAGQEDDESSMNAAQVLSNTGVKFSLKDEPGTIKYRTDGNGMPVVMLTKEQRDKARDIVRQDILSKIDRVVKKTQGLAGKYAPIDRGGKKDKDDEIVTTKFYGIVGDFVEGDSDKAEAASSQLYSEYNRYARLNKLPLLTNRPSRNVDEGGNVISMTLQYDNGEIETIDAVGKTSQNIKDIIFSATNPFGLSGAQVKNKGESGSIGAGQVNIKTTRKIREIDTGTEAVSLGGLTPIQYVESELDEDLDDWANATGAEIKKTMTNVVKSIMPQEMIDQIPFTIESTDAYLDADRMGVFNLVFAAGEPWETKVEVDELANQKSGGLLNQVFIGMEEARTKFNKSISDNTKKQPAY